MLEQRRRGGLRLVCPGRLRRASSPRTDGMAVKFIPEVRPCCMSGEPEESPDSFFPTRRDRPGRPGSMDGRGIVSGRTGIAFLIHHGLMFFSTSSITREAARRAACSRRASLSQNSKATASFAVEGSAVWTRLVDAPPIRRLAAGSLAASCSGIMPPPAAHNGAQLYWQSVPALPHPFQVPPPCTAMARPSDPAAADAARVSEI